MNIGEKGECNNACFLTRRAVTKVSGKKKGGGALLVNHRWC